MSAHQAAMGPRRSLALPPRSPPPSVNSTERSAVGSSSPCSLRSAPERRRRDWEVKTSTAANEGTTSAGRRFVNEYLLGTLLGTGGFGEVFLATKDKDPQQYAVKVLNKRRLARKRVGRFGTALQNVAKEVAIWKKLRHPNIVQLFEVIDDPASEFMYMVSEFVEGGQVLPDDMETQPLTLAAAWSHFRDLIAGLQYLHEQNIAHRDIKPSNLLVASDGTIKIADFGVSCTFSTEDDLMRSTAGTAMFAAPEMCSDNLFSAKAVDVWACGVTLYCMVLGRLPFTAPTLPLLYDKIVTAPLELPPGLEHDLELLLRGLLDKSPLTRLSLQQAKAHPWVTKHGTCPLVTEPAMLVEVTAEDVQHAISPLHRLVGIVSAHMLASRMRDRVRSREIMADSAALAAPDSRDAPEPSLPAKDRGLMAATAPGMFWPDLGSAVQPVGSLVNASQEAAPSPSPKPLVPDCTPPHVRIRVARTLTAVVESPPPLPGAEPRLSPDAVPEPPTKPVPSPLHSAQPLAPTDSPVTSPPSQHVKRGSSPVAVQQAVVEASERGADDGAATSRCFPISWRCRRKVYPSH